MILRNGGKKERERGSSKCHPGKSGENPDQNWTWGISSEKTPMKSRPKLSARNIENEMRRERKMGILTGDLMYLSQGSNIIYF